MAQQVAQYVAKVNQLLGSAVEAPLPRGIATRDGTSSSGSTGQPIGQCCVLPQGTTFDAKAAALVLLELRAVSSTKAQARQ
jgi:hypothetical protein